MIEVNYFPGRLKQDSPSSTGADNTKVSDEDEEYARILARMDELEKEELEAESEIVSEEEQSDNDSDENKKIKVDLHQFPDHKSLHQNGKFSEVIFCFCICLDTLTK